MECRRWYFPDSVTAIRPNYEIPQICISRPRYVSPACISNKDTCGVLPPVREYLLAAASYIGFDILKINLHLRVSRMNAFRHVTHGF